MSQRGANNFKREDFTNAFTGAVFASWVLGIVCLLQIIGLKRFYRMAVPTGFSGDAAIANLEGLLFACAIMGLVVKILSHQNVREKYDHLTIATLGLVVVPDIFVFFQIPFKTFIMPMCVIGEITFAIAILILFLTLPSNARHE
jgi:hypothetical protein